MKWIALAFALEVGLLPFDQTIMYDPPARLLNASWVFYTTLDAEVQLFDNHAFVGGSTEIREWKYPDAMKFSPERAGFAFNAGLRWGPVEIGFLHYCTHPVVPFLPYYKPTVVWEGAYEKIYIRVESGQWH